MDEHTEEARVEEEHARVPVSSATICHSIASHVPVHRSESQYGLVSFLIFACV